jgi:hypothetical protein
LRRSPTIVKPCDAIAVTPSAIADRRLRELQIA